MSNYSVRSYVNCPCSSVSDSGSTGRSRGLINIPQMSILPDVNNNTLGSGQEYKRQSNRLVRAVALNKPRG